MRGLPPSPRTPPTASQGTPLPPEPSLPEEPHATTAMELGREQIVAYLVDELGLDEDDAQDDTLLFSTGILDSFGLVSLMQFLEDKGGFKIKATEVSLDHFDTIERIVVFTQRRLAS